MAKVHGIAGEWARVRGVITGLWPLFLGVFATGFFFAVWFFKSPGLGAVGVALSLVGCGIALQHGWRQTERFFKGARGEEKVAGLLAMLPDSYHVFNDFPADGVPVDHVVVGPVGVFAVETKFWSGAVSVEDGRLLVDGCEPDRDPIAQVQREADLVRATLSARGWTGMVTPVLAFASNVLQSRCCELDGVVVMNASELAHSFVHGRKVLPMAELDRLAALMAN